MTIGKFCPLPLCILVRNFRIYLYIVSLVVILRNWVCDNWVYRFPKLVKSKESPKKWLGALCTMCLGVPEQMSSESVLHQCQKEIACVVPKHVLHLLLSGGNKRDKLKGTNVRDSQFFADFCRFSLFPGNYSISGAQIFAENRRKPQIFAENRRKLQEPLCPI